MTETKPLAEVVGQNARAHRIRHDAKLDDVARVARHYGLKWSTGRVGDLEGGRMPATLPTLFAVALTLGEVTGEPMSIADLTWFDGWVEVNPGLKVRGDALTRVLRGEPARLMARDVMEPGEAKKIVNEAIEQMRADNDLLQGIGANLRIEDLEQAIHDAGVAEHRVAKELDVNQNVLATLSLHLWQSTFSAERDRRAGPDANAQRKGQITRQMKDELRSTLAGLRSGDGK